MSPTIEAQRLGDDIPSHLIHEQEGWQCCCDNTTLVARYEERIAACEVLLQEFHRHLVAQQAESQSLRAELVAQRGWWDKLAQLFAGHLYDGEDILDSTYHRGCSGNDVVCKETGPCII